MRPITWALALVSLPILAQLFPFPGPGRAAVSGGTHVATFKGSAVNSISGAAASIATTTTLNVAAGDLIVVVFGAQDPAVGSSTVVCGSDSLTLATSASESSNYRVAVFYKQNASANAAATCTATYEASHSFGAIEAVNYSGIVTTGAFQTSACNIAGCNALAASSTSRTSVNITSTTANALLIACGLDWNGGVTHTAANGFTKRVNSTTQYLHDKSVSATGSYPAGNFATTSGPDQYFSFILSFGIA